MAIILHKKKIENVVDGQRIEMPFLNAANGCVKILSGSCSVTSAVYENEDKTIIQPLETVALSADDSNKTIGYLIQGREVLIISTVSGRVDIFILLQEMV